MQDEQLRIMIKNLEKTLAGKKFPPAFAKLYSHFTRIKMDQPGLKGWRNEEEFLSRMDDALKLIEVALLEKEIGDVENWREPMKRAGELLEWLSHPSINTYGFPLRLLSSAAYQIAGYPALALGMLNLNTEDTDESKIIHSLLKADFPNLLNYIIKYWEESDFVPYQGDKNIFSKENENVVEESQKLVIRETISSLGVLSSYMKWGEETRLETAVKKLNGISRILLHGKNTYSWLLAKLCAEVVLEYTRSSMRYHVNELSKDVTNDGKIAFERYLRLNHNNCKSLAWYSQVQGIEKLKKQDSFALCTPTGSGKTTIAELAIVQSLFSELNVSKPDWVSVYYNIVGPPEPIAMYLVPSRALATEVEAKLSKILKGLSDKTVKVTGLYGGTDWGPTDAWITSNDPTVLICTYEKAEALIRFLGPSFLSRLSLVIIDEAHSIQFDGKNDTLILAENRALRLESLANRLISYLDNKRIIALSAVAASGTETLVNWITGSTENEVENLSYRSTRQLIGRLEWSKIGDFQIKYDLLNDMGLEFNDDESDNTVPFIQNPFEKFPLHYTDIPKKYTGPKVRTSKRARPYLFWAAMQFAKIDNQGKHHSVLISVTQNINGYAEDFLYTLDKLLKNVELPSFFSFPTEERKLEIWNKCLRSCEDYFGTDSYEYRLLKKGIVVHHGSMPGLMARLLIELINQRIVNIVLATSTLSDGVNLPFEVVLIPTLYRNQEVLSVSEFKNLVGRAGRPGYGTEGRSLVILEDISSDWSAQNAKDKYFEFIKKIKQSNPYNQNTEGNLSPLAALMEFIGRQWKILSNSKNIEEFYDWLEKTIPIVDINEHTIESEKKAEEALDTLDSILLSSLVEIQQLHAYSDDVNLEDYLRSQWQKSYAHFANIKKQWMEKAFVVRGVSLNENIYSDKNEQRRLYKTSLPPRFAKQLFKKHEEIKKHLITGEGYSHWNELEKFEYICITVKMISELDKFKITEEIGKGSSKTEWSQILRWWLNPNDAPKLPNEKQKSEWIKFIKRNLEYRFNWGLGSVISIAFEDIQDEFITETSISNWPKTGLPWIVFWLKELIIWGTLDPVVAYLLSRDIAFTRKDAVEIAKEYYKESRHLDSSPNEILHPSKIRNWAETLITRKKSKLHLNIPDKIRVNLSRDFTSASNSKWRVLPIKKSDSIYWIDPAGYELAYSEVPKGWDTFNFINHDFILDSNNKLVVHQPYI